MQRALVPAVLMEERADLRVPATGLDVVAAGSGVEERNVDAILHSSGAVATCTRLQGIDTALSVSLDDFTPCGLSNGGKRLSSETK